MTTPNPFPTTAQIQEMLAQIRAAELQDYPADRLAARRQAFQAKVVALNCNQFDRSIDEHLLDPLVWGGKAW